MATLYVTEYSRLALDYSTNPVLVGLEPSRTQTVTIGGASNSGTLSGNTKFVRLHCDAICNVSFDGTAATTSNLRLAANQTEFFGVGNSVTSIAVIQGS